MVDSQVTSITPATHADRHSVGGADPLVNPLLLHASRHELGGDDKITIGGGEDATDVVGGNLTNGWADLDLSGVVGVQQCFVVLRITNASGGTHSVAARRKGNTGDINIGFSHDAASAKIYDGDAGTIITTTDTSGVIQINGGAVWAAGVYVEAFIPIG